MGVILFANGLAKLLSFRKIDVGPYSSFLINRDETRSILRGEAARNDVPGVPGLVNDVLLPNYGWLQWVVTFIELGVGALLILGLASRGAALIGLGQQLWLQLLYLSSGRWMFERPHEWVPLLILFLVPAARLGAGSPLRSQRDPAPSRLPVLAAVARQFLQGPEWMIFGSGAGPALTARCAPRTPSRIAG